MSQRVAEFVRRHRLATINRTKGLILVAVAVTADETGLAKRYTQPMIAHDLGAALPTVQRSMQALLRDGYLKKQPGRAYLVLAWAEHDLMTCEHEECVAEAAFTRRGAVSDVKRAQAAARARRMRERRKSEEAWRRSQGLS